MYLSKTYSQYWIPFSTKTTLTNALAPDCLSSYVDHPSVSRTLLDSCDQKLEPTANLSAWRGIHYSNTMALYTQFYYNTKKNLTWHFVEKYCGWPVEGGIPYRNTFSVFALSQLISDVYPNSDFCSRATWIGAFRYIVCLNSLSR